MTRILHGIMDDITLDAGFLIPDEQIDILCGWLASYADALEKAWIKKGSEGDPRKQKHNQVRSFIRAVERGRNGHKTLQEKGQANGQESTAGS